MVEFAWKMFPGGMLENILMNSSGIIKFPVLDEHGDIEYLWKTYSFEEYNLEDIYNEE